jgi:L-malate glycosyltransferase
MNQLKKLHANLSIQESTGVMNLEPVLTAEAQAAAPAEPRHILYMVDTFFGGFGGAEGALLRTVRSLPKDRYRASVVTFKVGPDLNKYGTFDCPFHIFNLDRTYDWEAAKTAWKINRLIREQNVSLVHTFFETSDLWGGLIAKLSGAPKLISSRRDMGILRQPKHKLLYRWMGPWYDQVHTVSEEVRDYMIKADGLDPNKVVTVYNGIDLERIDAAPVPPDIWASLGAGHAEQLIVTVCNVRRVKGLEMLLRSAARVAKEKPGAVFAIIGNINEPEYLKEIERLRDDLGIGRNVVFPGRRFDVFSILKSANVFCLPSLSEGLSNALLEATAAGLPAVATRVGGNPEVIIEGKTGYVVESGDDSAMADRVLSLLRDPVRASQMGEIGRSVVRAKFTTQTMSDRVVSLYDSLLKPPMK